MKKFTKQTILDYINGNDIDDFTLEELENNSDFMIEVIKITHDKNMISFASESVLHDYDFINTIMIEFKDDLKSISNIINDYIKNESDQILRMMLLTQLLEYTKGDYDLSLLFGTYAIAEFIMIKGTISNVIVEETKKGKKMDDYGLGFFLAVNYYNDNISINKYLAKRYLDEIFFTELNGERFEAVVHRYYKDVDDIKQNGIVNFLIKYISYYDYYLADYAVIHPETLEQFIKQMEHTIKNWDNYNQLFLLNKAEEIEEMVNRVFEKNHDKNDVDYLGILYKEVIKMQLEKYFLSIDKIRSYTSDQIDLINLSDRMEQFLSIEDKQELERFRKEINDLLNRVFIKKESINLNELKSIIFNSKKSNIIKLSDEYKTKSTIQK